MKFIVRGLCGFLRAQAETFNFITRVAKIFGWAGGFTRARGRGREGDGEREDAFPQVACRPRNVYMDTPLVPFGISLRNVQDCW